jgi:hypothetical protein
LPAPASSFSYESSLPVSNANGWRLSADMAWSSSDLSFITFYNM